MTDIQEKASVEPTVATQPLISQPTNGLAIASLITGVVAFTSGWIPFWGLLVGIAAVVLGILGLKKPNGKGLAISGISTGAVGLLSSLFVTLFFIIALVSGGELFQDTQKDYQSQTQEDRQMLNAKKNFSKGDTALLGLLEVKVNSVQRNYVPEDSSDTPDEGKEFVLVNLTVKNTGVEDEWVSAYTFSLDDGTDVTDSVFTPFETRFQNNSLSIGESDTGDVVYEVLKDAPSLKLQYDTGAMGTRGTPYQDLVYTLDI